MQRIWARHQFGKIAFSPGVEHARHARLGNRADLCLNIAQVLGHEPVLGQAAQLGMFGCVHLHQRFDQMRAAPGDRLGQRLGAAQRKHRAFGVVEISLVVLADLHHLIETRDVPKRFVAVIGRDNFANAQAVVAQPVELVEQRAPRGIGIGIDDGGTDVRRDQGLGGGHGGTVLEWIRRWRLRRSCIRRATAA